MGNRVTLASSHVLGESEIHQQAIVSGQSRHQPAVDGDGLFVTAGCHQLIGALRFLRLIVSLGAENQESK